MTAHYNTFGALLGGYHLALAAGMTSVTAGILLALLALRIRRSSPQSSKPFPTPSWLTGSASAKTPPWSIRSPDPPTTEAK